MATFQKQLDNKQPITVFGNGKQTRDFIFVKDVAYANLMAAVSPLNGITNIGSGKRRKIIDIARLYDDNPLHVENPRVGDIRHSFANIKKARKLWGWQPTTSFEDGFEKMQLAE